MQTDLYDLCIIFSNTKYALTQSLHFIEWKEKWKILFTEIARQAQEEKTN